jgi:hypothetical protein
MHDFVLKVVNEAGPRMPCSPQEAKAAQIIKEEFEKTCDDVQIEPFTCHPKAFLGWIKVDVIMVSISLILYLIMQVFTDHLWLLIFAIISFTLAFLPILVVRQEFFNYKEFIDPLFRKKSSQNVIGSFKPKGELKKMLIFSSHMDTALEFTLLKLMGWLFIPVAFIGIFSMLFWLVLSLVNLIFIVFGLLALKSLFLTIVILLLIIGGPCLITLFFFVPLGDKGNVVPGAVDNMSSCSIVQALARYLKDNRDIMPDNTEIRLISFGSEESGLRGSYRYAAAHLDELKKYDALVVNMDGIETPDGFHIVEYEPTTKTRHSEEVVQKLITAAQDVDIDATRFGAGKLEKSLGKLSGGSDAAAFSKAGIKASMINSADWKNRSSYYHQSTDTPDKIKEGTLEKTLKICISFIMNEKKAG